MALTTGGVHSENRGASTQINRFKSEKTAAAARKTVGSVLRYENITDTVTGQNYIEYHIDESGDGNVDVVRRWAVRPDAAMPAMHSPFAIVEIIEVYDEKTCQWVLFQEQVVDSRKLKTAPVYQPDTLVQSLKMKQYSGMEY